MSKQRTNLEMRKKDQRESRCRPRRLPAKGKSKTIDQRKPTVCAALGVKDIGAYIRAEREKQEKVQQLLEQPHVPLVAKRGPPRQLERRKLLALLRPPSSSSSSSSSSSYDDDDDDDVQDDAQDDEEEEESEEPDRVDRDADQDVDDIDVSCSFNNKEKENRLSSRKHVQRQRPLQAFPLSKSFFFRCRPAAFMFDDYGGKKKEHVEPLSPRVGRGLAEKI